MNRQNLLRLKSIDRNATSMRSKDAKTHYSSIDQPSFPTHQLFAQLCFNGCRPYKPKPQRKKQVKLFSLVLGLATADIIIPFTFGSGCVYAKKLIQSKISYVYGGSWR